jgi:hypothetical protein
MIFADLVLSAAEIIDEVFSGGRLIIGFGGG